MKFNPSATSIVRQLIRGGYDAYIVGGAVRDMLLSHVPKDYDITTNATPEQVRQVFGRRRCRIIGRRFRLALVFSDGETYEVSTFRREPTSEERCGRIQDDGIMIWNDNQYGTIDDDVRRRDFTANALYYDVMNDEVIDMVGGVQDIKARIVRSIGKPSIRFQEDPVRMLRALKLVGQHGFTLTRNIASAIRKEASLIQEASPARLFEELMKIVSSDAAMQIFEACETHGFLSSFCPLLSSLWHTEGGLVIREMLRLYGRCLNEEKEYYHEKSFALSILCLPYLLSEMDGDVSNYYENRTRCITAVRRFFSTFSVPREIEGNICEICMMIPMMASGVKMSRLVSSPFYPLAYELFRLLTMASGWMSERFVKLPVPCEQPTETRDYVPAGDLPEALDEDDNEAAAQKKASGHRRKKRRYGRRRGKKADNGESVQSEAE